MARNKKQTKKKMVFTWIIIPILLIIFLAIMGTKKPKAGTGIEIKNLKVIENEESYVMFTITNNNNTKANCTLIITLDAGSAIITKQQSIGVIEPWQSSKQKIKVEFPAGQTNITIKPECKNE